MDFQEKLQYSVNNKVLILIVLGILVLVNVLSTQFFFRWDWTENNQYSISEATTSILEQLDDLVTVQVYFSSDLPPQLVTSEQYVKDLLAEYEAYGSGNFRVVYEDVNQATVQQEAQQSGVQRVEMQVLEDDRYQVRSGYFGLTISYAGKSETIPVIQQNSLGSLEYDLTSLVVKLSQPQLNVVAFLQGHGEHGIQRALGVPGQSDRNDYSTLADALRKNYEVRTVDFAKNQTLDGVDLLVVAGPERDLTERDIFEIDQYLLAGGKALFLLDSVELLPNSVNIQPLDTNLKSLLAPLGVTLKSNLVLDNLAEFANFQVGPGRTFIVPYPFFIRLVADNFSDNPVVQKIPSLVVRFVSSLMIEEKEGLQYDRFLNSSPESWTQEGPTFQTNPNSVPQATADQGGASVIAVNVSGLMPRISPSDSVPVLQKWEENDAGEYELNAVSDDANRSGREVLTSAQSESSIIVVSDSDFVADPYLADGATPVVVVQNMVDYLTFGDDLISIRAKSLGDAPIKQLDATQKMLMKFLGILLVPLLISLYGVFRLWMRRKEEKMLNL